MEKKVQRYKSGNERAIKHYILALLLGVGVGGS